MQAIAIGGGLAGAAFAIEVARSGGRALVIERSSGAHHKVCGEFLSANARLLLTYLGISCIRLGGSPIASLRLADRTLQATAPLPFEATGISRFRLDEALLATAQDAGVEVVRASVVEGIEADAGGLRIHTTRGTHRATVAALASGKHNIRGFSRPGGPMVGFKIHVAPSASAMRNLRGVVQLYAFPGGYGGLCLVEDGVLSIAWNMRSEVVREVGGGWVAQQGYLARHSPRFAELTDGSTAAWDKPLAVSGQPYGFLRTQPLNAALYPVGDQLAVIPSFTGDGTALALASGISAAQAALRREPSHAFQQRIVAGHRTQFHLASALDFAIARAPLRTAGLIGARALPSVVTRLVAATRLRGFDDILAAARAVT